MKEKLLPVQDDVSSLIPNLDPPRGILGLLVAVMVHGLGGAVGVLPPLELGRVDLPLTVAEHDGLVTIPGGENNLVSGQHFPWGTREAKGCDHPGLHTSPPDLGRQGYRCRQGGSRAGTCRVRV